MQALFLFSLQHQRWWVPVSPVMWKPSLSVILAQLSKAQKRYYIIGCPKTVQLYRKKKQKTMKLLAPTSTFVEFAAPLSLESSYCRWLCITANPLPSDKCQFFSSSHPHLLLLLNRFLPSYCSLPTIFNPLSPNSDKHLISPHNNTTSSNIQDMRILKVITNEKKGLVVYTNSPNQYHNKDVENKKQIQWMESYLFRPCFLVSTSFKFFLGFKNFPNKATWTRFKFELRKLEILSKLNGYYLTVDF